MASFESKFCEYDGWDEEGVGFVQFYVTKWTDHSKALLLSLNEDPDNYDVFLFDSESGTITFLNKDGHSEISFMYLCV